jgi:hypothetical protein
MKYHEKYLSSGKSIQLVGIGFDQEEKNISHYKVKPVRMVGLKKGDRVAAGKAAIQRVKVPPHQLLDSGA